MPFVFALLVVVSVAPPAGQDEAPRQPLVRTVDLDRGESQVLELCDGTKARVKLLDVEEERDGVRSAIREARVKLEVNGQAATLVSANYRLPVTVGGVQIDCPVTRGYYRNCDPFEDSWGLEKDARLRLWPAGSPLVAPGSFAYPIRQRWFAGATQMGNEPSFVDGGDAPTGRPIYYHSGLDIGGCEGLVEVVSASDGLVVSAGGKALPEYPDIPFYKRADYDWEAYLREHKPRLLAVARPHHLIRAGEKVILDGSRSWSAVGKIERFEWAFTDGTAATGSRVERSYERPGEYSEVLKVIDARGRVDYDFAVVLVIDKRLGGKALEGKPSPTIHASYAPTLGIRPGDPVTFKVRSFFAEPTGETWDFGDGSPPVSVRSDGNAQPKAADGYAETIHRYQKPGHYLVRVERAEKGGARTVARLRVRVGEGPDG